MENFLGRQLWSIYEDLKRDNKIGFLTDDEFQKYFLGFISYKYLSEKLELYVNNLLKESQHIVETAPIHKDKIPQYKDVLSQLSSNNNSNTEVKALKEEVSSLKEQLAEMLSLLKETNK